MLALVATHGFVVIATNDTTVEEAAVVPGLAMGNFVRLALRRELTT